MARDEVQCLQVRVVRLELGRGYGALTMPSYHMQYAHGISATTTRPFSPPVRFRQVRRERIAKGERVMMMEGLCHQCKKWVAVEGVKDVEVKVKELFW